MMKTVLGLDPQSPQSRGKQRLIAQNDQGQGGGGTEWSGLGGGQPAGLWEPRARARARHS